MLDAQVLLKGQVKLEGKITVGTGVGAAVGEAVGAVGAAVGEAVVSR